jgi:hypothetical protein
MRLRNPAVVVFCALACVASAAERTTPYRAYVKVDEAYVRSGPGEGFYPTEKLRFGREVEVYRCDASGWCAIRPPEESFSWVAGWDLQLGDDGLAEVAADRVAARVGSQFSDLRDVVQVRLKRGEVVEVLGWKKIGAGSSAQTWYRIAPPAGEFRFIESRFLDMEPPLSRIVRTSGETPSAPSRSEVRRAHAEVGSGAAPSGSVDRPATRAAQTPPATASPTPDASASSSSPAPAAPAATPGASARPERTAPRPTPLTQEEFQAELDDINTELSIMLAEEPSVWNCDELTRRTESLLAQAQTASERGHARLLLNRVLKAADVKRRYDAMHAVPSATVASGEPASTEAGPTPRPLRGPEVGTERYDGMGKLTRVMPAKLGAPRYALLDERGHVRCYVTPAPGVNVQHYVGRRVGVNGIRSTIPEQNAPHVTAQHITPIEGRMLR